MTNLTINDLIRSGQFDQAVERMQEACRVYDPTVPINIDRIRAQYEATREQLKAVVPSAPIRITVIDSTGNVLKTGRLA